MKSAHLRLLLSRGGSRSLFILIALASVISAALVISLGFITSQIVVNLVSGENDVMGLIFSIAGIWLFRSIFQSQYELWCMSQAVKIKSKLRWEVTSAPPTFKSAPASVLSNLLIKGFNSLDIYLGRFLPQMAGALVTPILVIITIFYFDKLSAFIAIFTLPLIPIFGALIGRYTAVSVSNKWALLGTLSKYFEDSLRGFITLQIFGRQKSQSKRIREMGDRYTTETMKVLRVSFLSALVLELCATISVALIAVGIGLRLVTGNIDFLSGLTVLLLTPEVYFPLRNAASLFHASADATTALDEISKKFEDVNLPIVQSQISFTNFQSISWSKWQSDFIPNSINSLESFKIKRGTTVFLTGISGIGKSSFALNLLGVTHNADVLIDGEILLTPELTQSWQKIISWIPQSPQFPEGTIAEQFRFMDTCVTDEQISIALREVGLDSIDLPMGLDTLIGGAGENSSHVSGGQLRKIAVARALFKSPSFIVADEPTADLDLASAKLVMAALRRAVFEGAALACISHNLEEAKLGEFTLNFKQVAS